MVIRLVRKWVNLTQLLQDCGYGKCFEPLQVQVADGSSTAEGSSTLGSGRGSGFGAAFGTLQSGLDASLNAVFLT